MQKGPDIKKICVIDDNALILTTIRRALAGHGYEVYVASDRKEFASLCEKIDFDLIIIDYYLKDSTALDIKKDLQAKGKSSVSLLIMTGKEGPEGFNLPFIKKPFSIQELRRIVSEILSG